MIGRRKAPDTSRPAPADDLAAIRVEQARTRTRWREIEDTPLVQRGRWWVDAESDRMFSVYAGTVFGRDGRIAFDDQRDDLVFYVDRVGEVVVLEPAAVARTWSEYLYAREVAR
jgi:hypothetical protein